jgi:hypothetical protein
MRTTNRRISASTPGRPDRPFAYAHLRAINCRCHRRIVSGVTIVATRRSPRRPNRCPRTASRRRSSSLSRRRRPCNCPRRMRFSSSRYAPAACCCRSPADQRGEREPQEQRVNHGGSLSHRPKCSLAKQVGRVMGHYAVGVVDTHRSVDDLRSFRSARWLCPATQSACQ